MPAPTTCRAKWRWPRSSRYAREIVPTFNAYIYFRVGYSLARAVARFLYRVRLGFADERTLAGVPPEHHAWCSS